MDLWELNKIAMAVLLIVTSALALNLLSDAIYGGSPRHRPAVATATQKAADEAAAQGTAKEATAKKAAGDEEAKKGRRLAAVCQSCHTFNEGGRNKVGPNLWRVVGRKKASMEGFNYSKALNGLGGVWDEEALDAFLTAPSKYAKGTRMAFAGVKNQQKRKELIDWLKTLRE